MAVTKYTVAYQVIDTTRVNNTTVRFKKKKSKTTSNRIHEAESFTYKISRIDIILDMK